MRSSIPLLLLLTTLLVGISSYSTPPDPQIILARNLALLDSAHRKLDQDIILKGSQPTEVYKKISKLEFKIIRETTDEELLEFTRHENPEIRQLGIESLARRNSPLLFQVALERVCDSIPVPDVVSFGGTIANKAFHSARSFYWGDTSNEAIQRVRILDSLALFTECGRKYLFFQTLCMSPPDEWHDSIRSLVSNHKWGPATIVLAHFEDTSDVEILLDTLGLTGTMGNNTWYFLIFATWYHDERILTRLEDLLNSEGILAKTREYPQYNLYAAISSFRSERSAKIISSFLTRAELDQKEVRFAIHYAMMRSDHEVYDSLLLSYWSESKFMIPGTAVRLCRSYPSTAIQMAIKMLESIDSVSRTFGSWEIQNIFSEGYCELTNEMSFEAEIDTLLRFIQGVDSGWWVQFIRHRLEVSTYEEFKAVAKEAARSNHPSFIEPLFERYSNDRFNSDPVSALHALLSYDDQEIRKRLVAIRKRRPHLLNGWIGRKIDSAYVSRGLSW